MGGGPRQGAGRAAAGCGLLLVGLLVASVCSGAFGVVVGLASGAPLAEMLEGDLGAPALSAAMLAQFAAFLVVASCLAATMGRPPMTRAFALRPPAWAGVGLGVAGGLVVGRLPGWAVERLADAGWVDAGALELLSRGMEGASGVSYVAMVACLCLVAPVVEELVFRGVLWDLLDQAIPPWAVWLGTSLLFAAYHADPLWIAAVFGIGLFIGWLRMVTGSVWPGVAAHVANNTLAVVVTVLGVDHVPGWQAAAGVAGTLAAATAAWAWYRRVEGEEGDAAAAAAGS